MRNLLLALTLACGLCLTVGCKDETESAAEVRAVHRHGRAIGEAIDEAIV